MAEAEAPEPLLSAPPYNNSNHEGLAPTPPCKTNRTKFGEVLTRFRRDFGEVMTNPVLRKFRLNVNSNENESKNASGGACARGAKRPRVGVLTRCVFAFVFV